MKFKSAQELYDYINDGTDVYDVDEGVYIFSYNAAGSIAYYYLDQDELMELAADAQETGDYIAGLLGPGGYIVDTDNYDENEDIEGDEDITEILDFLEPLIGDEIISALPDDLVGNKSN